jgi:hypothetical protein
MQGMACQAPILGTIAPLRRQLHSYYTFITGQCLERAVSCTPTDNRTITELQALFQSRVAERQLRTCRRRQF